MRDIDIIERLEQIDNAIMLGHLASARAWLSDLESRLRDNEFEPQGLGLFLEAQDEDVEDLERSAGKKILRALDF